MHPPLTALPDRPPHRVKEMPANAATALPDGGRCIDETALLRDTAVFRRGPAFRCGGAP
jgi:hypothetical protein